MNFNYFGLNTVDYVIIFVILLFGLLGWKKGFMKSLVGIISLVASIIIAWLLYPIVSDILTGFGFKEVIGNMVLGSLGSVEAPGANETVLPKFIADAILKTQTDINTGISSYVADVILSIISFVFVLVIARIIIQIGLTILNIFSKLPVVSTLNHLTGLSLGLIKGTVIMYLAVVILLGAVPTAKYTRYKNDIENSVIINKIYSKNIIENVFIKNSVNENGE